MSNPQSPIQQESSADERTDGGSQTAVPAMDNASGTAMTSLGIDRWPTVYWAIVGLVGLLAGAAVGVTVYATVSATVGGAAQALAGGVVMVLGTVGVAALGWRLGGW